MRRRLHRRAGYRKAAGVTVVAALGLTAVAACSSSSSSGNTSATGGHVTISVNCAPPASSPVPYKEWNEDVAAFEKANPNITIHSIYAAQCILPATFTAQLAAGTEPNVFGTYFTDLNQVLDAGQAADITPYVNSKTVPLWNSIVPTAKKAVTAGTTLYGLPYQNYTQGLVINRQLFTQAGLNPDDPPTTWAQVEQDATAITKLGNGIYGYGDYSSGNNGGWHFASEVDAEGGQMVSGGATAAFNSAAGTAVLQALHTLRFTDKAMSATQGLAWGTLQKQMAAGKLGMYIAAPDDIYGVIVPQDGGNANNFGMGPLPSTSGTPAGSLSGGNDYMFAKRDTPAQIEAGIKFVNFEDLTLGQGQFNFARKKADSLPVGYPEPELFSGATSTQYNSLNDKYANVNPAYFQTFTQANEQPMGEPTDAQAVYKTLDPVMLSVLTNANANIGSLLSGATSQVNQILANSG
jgi:ABC-type glycerol-3-phosphate transport system substrate-binding protein